MPQERKQQSKEMANTRTEENSSSVEKEVAELTSYMVHKHYAENDAEAIIALMDEDILWLGAGEHEYAAGREDVVAIFRQFAGQVPKCNISDECYQVISLGPESYLCSGRMWIATDASTQISLRVHQRITTAFRKVNGRLRCCHIHISNPYEDMVEEDVGFPVKMASQSYRYLQEQIEKQKRMLDAQTEMLRRLSYEDALTGLYNRNKFKQVLEAPLDEGGSGLGVVCFDLNGLKRENDYRGHSAEDELICRAAGQIQAEFPGKAYRTGGDEFVVIEDAMDEAAFRAAVRAAEEGMAEHEISCSVGASWREVHCSVKEQYEEADHLMYEAKRRFYSRRENDRRSRS